MSVLKFVASSLGILSHVVIAQDKTVTFIVRDLIMALDPGGGLVLLVAYSMVLQMAHCAATPGKLCGS